MALPTPAPSGRRLRPDSGSYRGQTEPRRARPLRLDLARTPGNRPVGVIGRRPRMGPGSLGTPSAGRRCRRGRHRLQPHRLPRAARPRSRGGARIETKPGGRARGGGEDRRSRPAEPGRGRHRPSSGGKPSRELLRCRGGAAFLFRAARPAGAIRLQGDQHPRFHARLPRCTLRGLRQGRRAAR